MCGKSGEFDLSGIEEFLDYDGHALVLGGPGSGKTTGALIRVGRYIATDQRLPYQQVLFLSFARSTVARVAEVASGIIEKQFREAVELTTYHAFCWRMIRSHGYLLQTSPSIRMIPPHESAAKIAEACRGIDRNEIETVRGREKRRLLEEEGVLVFDLFADLAASLLEQSSQLRRIISQRFPLVVVDEFQDTNEDEYRLIKCLARNSQVIALADPDQRIYEFRGADPRRIQEFIDDSSPAVFDFEERNHRSKDTDILMCANDVLKGTFSNGSYDDVVVRKYPTRRGDVQHMWMKAAVVDAKNRSSESDGWSVGVLVSTRRMMLAVSDYLQGEQTIGTRRFFTINHEVAVDAEGPSLAGVAIGRLIERVTEDSDRAVCELLSDLCAHVVGRKGTRPVSKAESSLIDGLKAFMESGRVRGSRRQQVIDDCRRVVDLVDKLDFVGDPFQDWISVRDLIQESESDVMRLIADDARYLRFLHKGAQLRTRLSNIWREQGNYVGACDAVKNAFVQEHFLAKSQEPRGVHVMTIHKSKGKEFDEVVIYEGQFADRIVRDPSSEVSLAQARLSLRVAISRAKKRVTILTSSQSPCELTG